MRCLLLVLFDELLLDLLWKTCRWLLHQLHEKFCCSITVLELQPQNVPKVIVWNRSTSSQSSASRHPLATTSKDDTDDSGSECVEDFCMISGSHSSTLDRLYAWERKLYDEVKVFLTYSFNIYCLWVSGVCKIIKICSNWLYESWTLYLCEVAIYKWYLLAKV